MKTGIAGAGSLGSLFASFFLRSGTDTALYEISPGTIESIRSGLKIITPDGESVYHPAISGKSSILSDADAVFIFVKSYSTREAAADIAGAIKKDAIIVSLQNGLGNYEVLKEFFPAEQIVYGTTTYGAAKRSPSEIVFGGAGTVNIGGRSTAAVHRISELLETAGCSVSVTDNPDKAVWLKALINAGINPVASILSIRNGQILDNPYALDLQRSILEEAVQAAQSAGHNFDADKIIEETRTVCGKTAANICSMLQDIEAGRKTEIDSINIKIAETGEAAGLNMNYNRAVSYIINALGARGAKE
ncbi:MAG: 2-dehydropantoate 2-reductase [Spirochaetes bacterium]|nr:2-dehydropantoate 2-reductase [Spirochaetota bacterium]